MQPSSHSHHSGTGFFRQSEKGSDETSKTGIKAEIGIKVEPGIKAEPDDDKSGIISSDYESQASGK